MTEERIKSLEDEIRRLKRLAADAIYMKALYRQLLGPKGAELANLWDSHNITRFHADWGPDAAKMTGEERAEFLMSIVKGIHEGTLEEAPDV